MDKKELLGMSADIQLRVGKMIGIIYDNANNGRYTQDDIDNFITERASLSFAISDFIKGSLRYMKGNKEGKGE